MFPCEQLKNMIRALVIALLCMAVSSPGLSAQEKNYELKSATATVKDILSENIGRRVIVRMDTGDNARRSTFLFRAAGGGKATP